MSARHTVYLALTGIMEDGDGLRLLKESCEVKGGNMDISRGAFLSDVRGAHGLLLDPGTKIDAEVLDAAGPQLRVIASTSVGLDHIDLAECKRRGIKVGYTPDEVTDAVAEEAVGLALATARRFKEGMQAVAEGAWESTSDNGLYLCGRDIRNSTVGIVGLGRIGLAVAKRLQSFRVAKFLYCGRTPKDHAKEVHAEYVSFEKMLRDSDFVIACCSINKSNKLLFNADAFKKMKPTAIFINVSRGVLVDQDALYDALTSGELLAAGLDVTTPEPFPTDHKLQTLDNCTLLPHLGTATVATRYAMVDLTARNILAGLRGEPLITPAPA